MQHYLYRCGTTLLMIIFASCIGDPSGVIDMGPTESTLSVSFTGDSSICQVTASWDTCPDVDFESYSLYRSPTPDISSDTTIASKLYFTYDAGSSSYIDTSTTWDTVYFYAIRSADSEGFTAWSNEDSILTP